MLYNWLKLYLKIFLRYFFALPLVGGRRLFGSEIFIKNLDFWIHYVKNHHFFSLGISYWPRFISLVLLLVKRQYSLDLLRAVFHKSFRIVRKQYPKYCVDNIINHWFIRQLCIHGDMRHLVAFWALKKLELLLAAPRATLTLLLCSPNFPRASYPLERTLMYECIVNYHMIQRIIK